MDRNQFLIEIKKVMETESNEVMLDSRFDEIDEIDSLTIMSICSWVNTKFNKKIKFSDFSKFYTIADLFHFIFN